MWALQRTCEGGLCHSRTKDASPSEDLQHIRLSSIVTAMSQDQIKKEKEALKNTRLAEALRANLRRRKDQMRARKSPDSSSQETEKNSRNPKI